MIRNPRAVLALVFLVALGLLTATYVIWTQGQKIGDNETTIRQQRAQAAKDRAALAAQRRFAQALADQVRHLGGTPTPQPDSGRTPPTATVVVVSVAPSREGTSPRPSPQASATPRPTVSPKPTPSASPTRLCVTATLCLPPGGVR